MPLGNGTPAGTHIIIYNFHPTSLCRVEMKKPAKLIDISSTAGSCAEKQILGYKILGTGF